jgi:hypothetical protein
MSTTGKGYEEMSALFMKAEQGDAQAQFEVGSWFLLQAHMGLQDNFAPARKWLKKSADQDHSESKNLLKEFESQEAALTQELGLSLLDKTKKRLKMLLTESANDLKISELDVYPGVSSEDYANAMFDALTSENVFGKKFDTIFKYLDVVPDEYGMPSELAIVGSVCGYAADEHLKDKMKFYRHSPAFINIEHNLEQYDYFYPIVKRIYDFSVLVCVNKWTTDLEQNSLGSLDFFKRKVLQFHVMNSCVGGLNARAMLHPSYQQFNDSIKKFFSSSGDADKKALEHVLRDLEDRSKKISVDLYDLFGL